jgi:hypothetical protein
MPSSQDVAISHLQRRKIEGRVLVPFIETLKERLGEAAARELVDLTIRRLAVADGARWAEIYGHDIASLRRLAEELWAGGGGIDIELVGESDDHLDFNVRRCRYAEFYQEMGLSELGYRVCCNRDHAMLAGFNEGLELTRSQTLMEGAACCDFRYRKKP